MRFSLFIAKRYLFSKKSHNVINVISGISVAGIALASFAIICALSVFNGFHQLVSSLFTEFDPALKVTSVSGGPFSSQEEEVRRLCESELVEICSFSLESQALIQYKNKQEVVVIKGVEDSFYHLASIGNILVGSGTFTLEDEVTSYGIPGIGLAHRLDCGIQPLFPFTLYVPRREGKVNMINLSANFNSAQIYSPGLVFQVNQQKYDENYLLIPLSLARKLLDYESMVSSVEIRLRPGVSVRRAKRELSPLLGDGYLLLDQYEQQADVLKIVNVEKYITFIFFIFILFIACFNIIGSTIMLIIEKKADASLLSSVGADRSEVSSIFLYQGLLVSLLGALVGLAAGTVAALLQQKFGFIPMGSMGEFVVDAYPVSVKLSDIALVFVTVAAVCWLSVLPVKYLVPRFLK